MSVEFPYHVYTEPGHQLLAGFFYVADAREFASHIEWEGEHDAAEVWELLDGAWKKVYPRCQAA